jgi:hypothetical protein
MQKAAIIVKISVMDVKTPRPETACAITKSLKRGGSEMRSTKPEAIVKNWRIYVQLRYHDARFSGRSEIAGRRP